MRETERLAMALARHGAWSQPSCGRKRVPSRTGGPVAQSLVSHNHMRHVQSSTPQHGQIQRACALSHCDAACSKLRNAGCACVATPNHWCKDSVQSQSHCGTRIFSSRPPGFGLSDFLFQISRIQRNPRVWQFEEGQRCSHAAQIPAKHLYPDPGPRRRPVVCPLSLAAEASRCPPTSLAVTRHGANQSRCKISTAPSMGATRRGDWAPETPASPNPIP